MKVTPVTGNRGKRVFPSRCNLPRKEAAVNFCCPSVYHKIKGISNNILESYIAAENKADFESLFYLLTGVTFEYYLHKCEGTK